MKHASANADACRSVAGNSCKRQLSRCFNASAILINAWPGTLFVFVDTGRLAPPFSRNPQTGFHARPVQIVGKPQPGRPIAKVRQVDRLGLHFQHTQHIAPLPI